MRIAINGFGRVGRAFLRIARERGLEIVAVNDLTDTRTLAHLLAYDSTYGRFEAPVERHAGRLVVDGREIAVLAESQPEALPWAEYEVDVVIEATGRFRSRKQAAAHLSAGARKVLISAPGKGAVDATIVMGVNETAYDPARHDVISNASCTTNCVAPMVDVLHRHFGLLQGYMTTIHGYTNDQRLLDAPHKDLRRARSAALNIIPTSTGAAKAVGLVIPELAGRLDGIAVRVPVPTGSLVDLTALLSRTVTADEIRAAFAEDAATRLRSVLRVTEEPAVSADVIADSASCVFDATLTQADGNMAKVYGWYDNEWGYTTRLVDLAEYVGARLPVAA